MTSDVRLRADGAPGLPPRPNGGNRVLNVLAVLLIGLLVWAFGGKRAGDHAAAPVAPSRTGLVADATVENFGSVVYRGPVDLSPTLARIGRGEKLRFRDDGIVFGNRESRLPVRAPGYYHEWVHPTEGIGGPGPQRVVTGEAGEVFYTPNHYRSFQRLP